MDLSFLLPPLLGAVIGYVTNDIAIRMLFRPLKPVYIGKFRLPFTPGMIPKEQARIAGAVAHTISADLLDEASLRSALLSEEMLCRVDSAAERLAGSLLESQQTPEDILYRIAGQERTQIALEEIKIRTSEYVCRRLHEAGTADVLTELVADKVKRKMPFLPSAMIVPVQEQIAVWVDDMLVRQCPQILYDIIGKEADAWLKKPAGEIAAPYEERIFALSRQLREGYVKLMEAALPKILAAVDIEAIIEQKINAFSAAEMEQLLRTLMKKELSAIIWLGSLLGFLMGWLNLLIL